MVRRTTLAASIALVFAPFNTAFAQLKDWGNRVEGTQFHPNGLRDYELLGFYAYREDFSLRDDVNLRLRFFVPEDEPVFVEARELTAYKQYAMRAKSGSISKVYGGWSEFPSPNTHTKWPVSDVLKPNGITSENLGVIVRLKTNAEYEEHIAPAMLFDERQPPQSAIAEYILYLKFAKTLRYMEYRVDGVGGYSKIYPWVNPASPKDPSVEAGPKIAVKIPAQPIPAGPVTIHIGGPYANSTSPKLEIIYHFYHKPL